MPSHFHLNLLVVVFDLQPLIPEARPFPLVQHLPVVHVLDPSSHILSPQWYWPAQMFCLFFNQT